MRQKRISNHNSLQEEAMRLGISHVELSQMENGIIRPFDYDALRDMAQRAADSH